jgi:VWFA-related protein
MWHKYEEADEEQYDHYFPTDEERLGPRLLSDITELTGGRASSIDNPNDLADVATKIGIELRNQYVLGYRPTNTAHDGKWHKLRVKLTAPKGLPPLRVLPRLGIMPVRNDFVSAAFCGYKNVCVKSPTGLWRSQMSFQPRTS